MPTRNLLVEIGTEELPPKSLAALGVAFARGIAEGLAASNIEAGRAEPYFSPRRLAVLVESVGEMMPASSERRLGPAVKAAFDADGKPTRAAEGFAASCGVDVDALETVTDNGKERVAATLERPGRPTQELLGDIVEAALAGLPVARRMRWGAGTTEFVRPVHWVVLLFGEEIVAADVLGIRAGGETRGHRFHAPDPVGIVSADEYVATLAAHKVRLNDARGSLTEAVREAATEAAATVGGRPLGLDTALADEVAALNEWPVAVVGGFDERFLALPPEVLVTTLEHHQRYFPVAAADRLLPYFIAFANIESTDPGVVRGGNERVVAPRLEDAMFFWDQDRATTLDARRGALADVSWQKRLGSLGDKSGRIAALAADLAPRIGGDADTARRAGELAKCDLLTAMVGEFPELQGTLGRYYALHDGEPDAVAQAIEEHYLPRFAGDRLPESAAGRALALADRVDTLAGVFAAGQRPTGDKDPFGLRRAASGVLRIMMESGLDLDLQARRCGRGAAGRFPERITRRRAVRFRTACARADAGTKAQRCGRRRSPDPAGGFRRPRARGGNLRSAAGSGCARRGQQTHREHPAPGGRGGRRFRRTRLQRARRASARCCVGRTNASRRADARGRWLYGRASPARGVARAGRRVFRPGDGHGR